MTGVGKKAGKTIFFIFFKICNWTNPELNSGFVQLQNEQIN